MYLTLALLRRRLAAEIKSLGSHATDLQRAKVLEHSNALLRKIEAWAQIQHFYMPLVSTLRAASVCADGDASAASLKVPLFLPSAVCATLSCYPTLLDSEYRLRVAQAHDILNNLRRHLRLRSHLYNFKDRFVRGQRPNTRARSVINTCQDKIDADVAAYR